MLNRTPSKVSPAGVLLLLGLASSALAGGGPTPTPVLSATKADAVVVGGPEANPGDTLRYTIAISNTGTGTATGVSFGDTPGANLAFVAGSVRSTCVAVPQSVSTNEDTNLLITLQGVDPDGQTLTFTIVPATGPTKGTLSAITPVTAATANVTFMPSSNLNGPDSFQFMVQDPTGNTDTATVSIDIIPVNDPPTVTAPGPFAVTPHIRISVPDGASDLLANASDPEGTTVSVNDADGIFVTANGGTVTANTATGQFTYDPPRGSSGPTDMFQYSVCDNGLPLPAACSGNVTVTFNISGNLVWFVDNSAGAGDGRLQTPYNSIAAFVAVNGTGTAPDPQNNQRIFIRQTVTGYTGPMTLRNGQLLFGSGAIGTDFDTLVLGGAAATLSIARPAINGTNPAITTTVASTNGITLGSGNTLRGISVGNTTGAKIFGSSFGTLTVGNSTPPDVLLSGSGQALNLTTGAFAATSGFSSVATTSSGTQGIALSSVSGTASFGSTSVSGNTTQGILMSASPASINFGNTSVTGGTDGVSLQNAASGTRSFGTLGISGGSGVGFLHAVGGGNVSVTGAATIGSSGNPIDIQNAASGTTITFAGTTVTKITAGGAGVNWGGTNTGATLTFNTLALTTSNGPGLVASGGGTINVTTATGSSISATGSAGQAAPAISANGVAFGASFASVSSASSLNSGNGVSLTNVTGTLTMNGGSITSAAGTDFLISGGTANVTYAGSITDDVGQLVSVASATSGTKTFSGAISDGPTANDGGGISLTSNAGATINFSGGLALSTGGTTAFTATGPGPLATSGGTVNVTDPNPIGTPPDNTLTTSTGTALNMQNTTIGSSNLEFRSIASNGAVNGIVLNNTGSSGGLKVTGAGASAQGGDGSGGLIQNATSHGISLISTSEPSFTNMTIQNTAGSGIYGEGVTDFAFDNGTITGSGDATQEANIELNGCGDGAGCLLGANIVTGVVTITDSVLNTAFDSGIYIEQFGGTISNLTVSNNSFTSTTSTATSKGDAVKVVMKGNASTAANLTRATISNNVIDNFPSNGGIRVFGGNVNATGPAGFVGDPTPGTDVISITGNSISGQSAANRMGTSAILVSINGGNSAQRSQGNFIVSNNNPLTNMAGIAISVGHNGYADGTYVMDGNVIVANNTVASSGIGGGNGIVLSAAETPNMTWTITNNNISNVDGNGILAVSRGVSGTMNVGIRGNTVGASLTGVRPGIRVDAGNAASVDDAVCVEIANNASGGSGGSAGIGIRKQGSIATTNDFGIEGLSPSPATCGQAEDRVSSLNPGTNPGTVATGTDCDGNPGSKTLAISGSNFVSCNTAP